MIQLYTVKSLFSVEEVGANPISSDWQSYVVVAYSNIRRYTLITSKTQPNSMGMKPPDKIANLALGVSLGSGT